MPFLTRDFAIFLGLVAFLLAGITATGTSDMYWGGQGAAVAEFADTPTEEVTYSAVLPTEEPGEARADRVRTLSAKVGDFLAVVGEAVLPEPEPEPTVVAGAGEEDSAVYGAVMTCSEYGRSNPIWTPQGLEFEVVEGALLVYREQTVLAEPVVDEASTTISLMPTTEREVVLQLPHRLFATGANVCLGTDVVGIALDGSLIRNTDYTAYRVFGSETQIGYALDGYAIYGSASFATDTCGGSDVSGEYRYYLSNEREGVLGCFSATPASL